jgi:Tfp pilus assembly protein PilN
VRELEFLPEWYPNLQRRKRALIVQGWLALALVLCMAAGAAAQRWEVRRQQQVAQQYTNRIAQSAQQLAKLDALQQQQQQLQQRKAVVGNLDTAKLLAAIAALMPADTSLLELDLESHGTSADRQLGVHLQGVAPADGDVASLLVKLNAVRFFDQVQMSSVRDRVQNGHVQREFDVSFVVQDVPVKGK